MEYLQQVIITTVVKYNEIYNQKRAQELQSLFATKKAKNITLNDIINYLPKKLRTDVVNQNCEYVRNVRNDVSAHPYYAVGIGRLTGGRYEYRDVNAKRKYIRRIRKHVRNNDVISETEKFLRYGNPLTIYRESDQLLLYYENLILKDVAENVKKSVEIIAKSLGFTSTVQTSKNNLINEWM